MAGRVERRINDKFYFVLDEVGGSSDGETETASDKDADLASRLIEKSNGKEGKDSTYASKGNDKNKIKDRSPSGMEIKGAKVSFNSSSTSTSDDREAKTEVLTSSNKALREEENGNEDIFMEESSAVVDMDVDSDVDTDQPVVEPLLRITFRDEGVEENLKSSLFKFLSQKIDNCTIITNSENSLELKVYNKDPATLLRDDVLDFDLDTTPSNSHSSSVPFYGKNHNFVLSDKVIEEPEKSVPGSMSCFNCLGNHNLRDCTKEKDFEAINRNRSNFQTNKPKKLKSSRYHLDENQKFSHILPGVISKKLRNALSLRRDQQPSFIYRMRILGYPPAWLEEAKVSHSGVAMYDNIGVPVLEEDEEEGEILPEGAKDKFDITKIIEFPGFNVPLPKNFKDETKYYHCPAMSEIQSKGSLIKQLEPKTVQAYVKKSLKTQKSDSKLSPKDDPNILSSPTIEEMEEKKRQLLMELNDEDAASDARLNSEDSYSGTGAESETAQSSAGRGLGSVKNSEYGTPILKSFSPFSKLPSREQFSVNVSDVINFENLPNSTGKYETMRNVITKIRVSASKGHVKE